MRGSGRGGATHNQALNALVFLYREVLAMELGDIAKHRARRAKRVPEVLTVEEVKAVMGAMAGKEALVARLLYGCGLRVSEALGLRIKDLDVEAGLLTVRGGKGGKERVVELPACLAPALRDQLARAQLVWEADRRRAAPGVELPHAFATKSPHAGERREWFWVFPATQESTDPRSGTVRRHPSHRR